MTLDIKMTSLDIAEIVGKKHQHIMRDIRNEIESLGDEIGQSIFGQSSYINLQNKEQPCYEFGKDGAMQLALKYDAKTRFKVIKRIEELENNSNKKLPGTYKEALIQLVGQVEQNERLETNNLMLEQRIGELKPKADYTNLILKNNGLVLISQISKDYGMSANEMNKLLHELKVQYKRGKQWLLYATYHDKGYTHSDTFEFTRKNGVKDVSMTTMWTQRGRLFLYELLKEKGITPIIEKEIK
jgi:Rha family phage regulatory protein